jgi:hypothetical protein
MGSDHDVFQEGSFRIPTIYLRDWPDVYIHTNNDVPANIDATKIKRSAFIAAASGYFLSRAGAREAARLADEVFIAAHGRIPRVLERARKLEEAGTEGDEEARNTIARSLEIDATAIASVQMFAPGDKSLESKVESLIDQLSGAWLLLTGQISQQTKGKRVFFVIEPKEVPRRESKDQRPRNPKDAAKARPNGEFKQVPSRKVLGPTSVYYYDYLAERVAPEDARVIERLRRYGRGEVLQYEILNLVDGKRTVQEIRDYLAAAYAPMPVVDVFDYLRVLERAGVVRLE